MRPFGLLCCAGSMAGALAGCSATREAGPVPALPPSIGNGLGSQYGNYGAVAVGETRGPSGERCVLFNWDRPLGHGLAIRYTSASCDSAERPGWMICHEISRTVIPIAESNLGDATAGDGE